MPDKIAIISDVHGNLPALETVLADIAARGIETIYCLGDMVGKGPNSAEIVDILRPRCPVIIRGNWEDGIAHWTFEPERMQYWHQQMLGTERRAWIGKLPYRHDFYMSGRHIRLIHATPQKLHIKINPNRSYDEWLTMFEATEMIGLDAPEVDLVIFGHTHIPQVVNLYEHGKTVLNVGSVGNPTDGMSRASYCILEGVLASTTPAPFSHQLVRLPYDIDQALENARCDGFPDFKYYSIELKDAIYRGRIPEYAAMIAARRAKRK